MSEPEAISSVSVLSGGDGNELFVSMDANLADALHTNGHAFYAWPSLPNAYRLVTSFTTEKHGIDESIRDIRSLSES